MARSKVSNIRDINYVLSPFLVDIKLCDIGQIGIENRETMGKLVGRIICDVPLIYQAYLAETEQGLQPIGDPINNKYWFAPTVGQIADALRAYGEDASKLEAMDQASIVLLNVAAFQSVEAALT